MSAGMTYRRPRRRASARAAWMRLIEPRGLAPNEMYLARSGWPTSAGSRVAATIETA